MIHAFEVGLMQAAARAAPGLFVQGLYFGLNAPDKKKDAFKHDQFYRYLDACQYVALSLTWMMNSFIKLTAVAILCIAVY
jgi:hypothetical protein